ncbi:hypothetical protein ACRRTK_019883 [Alexandromys fortis]
MVFTAYRGESHITVVRLGCPPKDLCHVVWEFVLVSLVDLISFLMPSRKQIPPFLVAGIP